MSNRVPAAVFLRRALLAAGPLLAVWSLIIAATGGFVLEAGSLRFSSRNAQNPLLLAAVAWCAAAIVRAPSEYGGLRGDLRWWWALAAAAIGTIRRFTTAASRRAARAASAAGIAWPVLVRAFDPVVLLAIAGGGLVLSTWWLGRPLWLDEEMIALNIRDRTLAQLLEPLSLEQRAPYGWLAIERVTGSIFGFSDLVLRAVPVIFALVLLGAAAAIGKRWMTTAGASVLVALCAAGPWTFYHALELKHYSADMLFGLLLPAFAAFVTEAAAADARSRRALAWWLTAAVGQWFANGALFVTPACALALCLYVWRTDGFARAVRFALYGFAWLACFALYYALTLRYTVSSQYMREFWAVAMLPQGAGVPELIAYVGERAALFAEKPGGAGWVAAFWVAAAGGFLLSRRRTFGLTMATVPASMFLFGILRMVPIFERLSVWALPAAYVGIALGIDAGIRPLREAFAATFGRRRPDANPPHQPIGTARPATLRARVIAGVAVAALSAAISVQVLQRGRGEFLAAYPPDSNHQLDDRSAVQWLIARARPGDAVLTTKLATPALWWYGGGSVAPGASSSALAGGLTMIEVGFQPDPRACHGDELARALAPFDRVLVYLGFRFDDVPQGFDDLLLDRLAQLGQVSEPAVFPGVSRALVVDLRSAPGHPAGDAATSSGARLEGCLPVREPDAHRW